MPSPSRAPPGFQERTGSTNIGSSMRPPCSLRRRKAVSTGSRESQTQNLRTGVAEIAERAVEPSSVAFCHGLPESISAVSNLGLVEPAETGAAECDTDLGRQVDPSRPRCSQTFRL